MKAKKILYLISFLFAGICMTSCYKDAIVILENTEGVGQVSFSKDVIPIFNTSCNISSCHDGSIAPNLKEASAYNALKNGNYINTANPEASELYQWMKGNRRQPMPLSGPNPTYNSIVLAWIQQGALNN